MPGGSVFPRLSASATQLNDGSALLRLRVPAIPYLRATVSPRYVHRVPAGRRCASIRLIYLTVSFTVCGCKPEFEEYRELRPSRLWLYESI